MTAQLFELPPPSVIRAYHAARLAWVIASREQTIAAWAEAKLMNDRYKRLKDFWRENQGT